MNNLTKLEEEIEYLRLKLNSFSQEDLRSKATEILAISEELDKLVFEYHKLKGSSKLK